MQTKKCKPLLLLLAVTLFMACEESGWIIADIPPPGQSPAVRAPVTQPEVTQPTSTQAASTQPSAAAPVTIQPFAAQPVAGQQDIPPFVISRPVVEIKERLNGFKYAGIVFKFLNNTEMYVEKITICFMLFDTKTQTSPFLGSNKFEITKHDFLSPGENKEISISLDNYIYIAPTEPYLIDFFYIAEINYLDDIIWRDTYGKYRVR